MRKERFIVQPQKRAETQHLVGFFCFFSGSDETSDKSALSYNLFYRRDRHEGSFVRYHAKFQDRRQRCGRWRWGKNQRESAKLSPSFS